MKQFKLNLRNSLKLNKFLVNFCILVLLNLIFYRGSAEAQQRQCNTYDRRGFCYQLYRPAATWDDAQANCERTGGKLVSIYDDGIQTEIRTVLVTSNYTGDVWLSGRQEEPLNMIGYPQSLWRWVKDCPECQLRTVCDGSIGNPLDLAVVIDNTNGISQDDVNRMIQFGQALVQNPPMVIGTNNLRVSVVRMSDVSVPLQGLSSNAIQVSQAFQQISASGSFRNINNTLTLLRTNVFSGGADRPNAPNVAVVVTMGPGGMTVTNVAVASQRVLDAGIVVYPVGVGGTITDDELKALSTPPKLWYNTYYTVNTTVDLINQNMAGTLRARICTFHRLYLSLNDRAVLQQGCYNDQSSPIRDLPYDATSQVVGSLDPQTCAAACTRNNFVFAAAQNGNTCYCDNTFGTYPTSGYCTSTCPGNDTFRCGAFNTNNIFKVNGEFSAWAFDNSQPNNLANYQWCAAMDILRNRRFDDQNCNNEYNFLCAMPMNQCQSTTDARWFVVANQCFFLDTVMDTWYRGRQTCLQRGGNLFVMTDDSQRVQLDSYFQNSNYQERFIFVGLSRNIFYWMDERGGTEMTFNQFAPKEPQPTDGNVQNKCTYLSPTRQYNWATASCDKNNSYICQYVRPATAAPTLPPAPASTTTVIVPPVTGGRTEGGLALPPWAIALLALLGLLLLLLLLLLCCCCCCKGWCFCCRGGKGSRVEVTKVADVRPKAPVPQTGKVGKMDDIHDTYSVTSSTAYML